MAPLVLLVGRNNTGKSYIATLLWALTNIGPLLAKARDVKRPKWFEENLKQTQNESVAEIQFFINTRQRADIVRYVNSVLETEGHRYFSEVFAFNAFSDAKVQIRPPEDFEPFDVTIGVTDFVPKDEKSKYLRMSITVADNVYYSQLFPNIGDDAWRRAFDRAFVLICGRCVFGDMWGARSTTYLPAARTGLMLAFRSIVGQLLATLQTADDVPPLMLPRPTAQFLQGLAFTSNSRRTHSQIAEWLEAEAIRGQILAETNEEIPTFSFVPTGSKMKLPLHAASSMVTELAPFLVLLRRGQLSQLVFEEPEAHLHLSAQRVLAQALGRLSNEGTSMILTTHSDTFVQQINILMALHRISTENKALVDDLGYSEHELIDPSTVVGYEFVQEPHGMTTVKRLEMTTDGLVVPSLNAVLIDLADDAMRVQDEGAGEDD